MLRFLIHCISLLLCVCLCSASVLAQPYSVSEIQFEGLIRVPIETALEKTGLEPGEISSSQVSRAVKNLYRYGAFKTVTAEVRDSLELKRLVFVVDELPSIRKVFIKGNEELSESDLDDVLTFKPNDFASKAKVEEARKKAEFVYQNKGYYDVSIEAETEEVGGNQFDLTFTISEGSRFKIDEVKVGGLDLVDEDDLLSEIETQRYRWWSSWITGSGRLNKEILKNDKQLMKQYLYDNGFVDATVSDAFIERQKDRLVVHFDVSEGPKYNFGSISVQGDLIEDSETETLEGIDAETGEVFNASHLRSDSFVISDKFADIGYAFANVTPETKIDRSDRTVNVTFKSSKGSPVYIRRIDISGNDKTLDNVIRREFVIQEGELFSGRKVKRSKALLERLGYFEEVNFNTEPVDNSDKVDIDVAVREASTGTFSMGAGYSTSDGVLFNTRVSENNILGTGRRVNMNVDVGTERSNVIFSLYDRRTFDTYWSTGLDLFRTDREFRDFDRSLTGAGFQVGYPLEQFFEGIWAEDIDFSIKYEYIDSEISDVDPNDAAPLVIRSEGSSRASGFTPKLRRNTINNPINPTRGSRQTLSIELTGLGGNEEYYLADFRNQWYYPMLSGDWGDLVFAWRFRASYGESYDEDDDFPLFRRFFPGGINSVRGYKARTMGPKDEDGNEFGGSKQVINNLEVIFPLINDAGLRGLVFFDAGEAFDDEQSIEFGDLRKAYGFGIRWTSPLGPIRLEFGFPMDEEEDDDNMVTLFSFGAPIL